MRNLLLLIFSLSSFFLSSCTHSPQENLKELTITPIEKGVYVATDKNYHDSRVLLVQLEDGTLYISSSPFESQETEKMMKWIVTNLKPKKIIAINTHYHLDGTGGNEIYHKYQVETWASDLTNQLLKERGQRVLVGAAESFQGDLKERLLQSPVTLAKNVFPLKQGKTFQHSDEEVQVYFPGEAHAPDNVVVYFKKRKLMFGGCMIKPGSTLGYLGDANVESWVGAAKNLQSFEVKTVVAGHAPWGGPELIEKTLVNARKSSKK